MFQRIRTKLSVLIAVFILAGAFAVSVYAEQDGPDTIAEGYCVLNMKDGSVVFSKNMEERFYPASITKIMTALVVLEHCDNLDDQLVFNEEVMGSISADSSTLHPVASLGEVMTVRDALFGMMLNSANECASALAVYTAGSIPAFADMMNQKAAEIGAVNTHFVNAHGLHSDDHYTTPHDMALIFQAALKNDDFRYIDATRDYIIPATNMNEARAVQTTNAFLNGSFPYEGVFAGKTGNTPVAGRTLCTAFYRDGIGLISVIMKSDNDNFYIDTATLLDHAYNKVLGDTNEKFTATDDYVMVRGDIGNGLRVRRLPSQYAAVMSSLAAGERVYRIGTFGSWSLVQADNGRYFASSEFLVYPDGSPTWTNPGLVVYGETLTAPDLSSHEETAPAETQSTTEEEESSEEEGSEATELTETEQSARTVAQLPENPVKNNYTYQVDSDTVTIMIIAIIVLIAVFLGIIGAILVRRK